MTRLSARLPVVVQAVISGAVAAVYGNLLALLVVSALAVWAYVALARSVRVPDRAGPA